MDACQDDDMAKVSVKKDLTRHNLVLDKVFYSFKILYVLPHAGGRAHPSQAAG